MRALFACSGLAPLIACTSPEPWAATRSAASQAAGALAEPRDGGSHDAAASSPPPAQGGSGSSNPASPLTPPVMFDSGLPAGQCAGKDLSTLRVVPTIWLLVDGSGSMTSGLGDTTRWQALRDTLLDEAHGLVKPLERAVNWGFVMYDGRTPQGAAPPLPDEPAFAAIVADACPRLITVMPKRDNFADIRKMYTSYPPGGSTPTDKALEVVVEAVGDRDPSTLEAAANPNIVVLATDGEPNDYCKTGDEVDVKPRVLEAVKRLHSRSVRTYVVSLAGEADDQAEHLRDVAAAGGGGKQPFLPASQDELQRVLRDIIGPGIMCEVRLKGMVQPGRECEGRLELDGKVLNCASDNGWRLKDPSTIVLTGSICEAFKSKTQSVLHAEFPCEAQALL